MGLGLISDDLDYLVDHDRQTKIFTLEEVAR